MTSATAEPIPPSGLDAPSAAGARVLLVRTGTLLFGLPLSQCTEVITCTRFTPLPGSEPFVRGLINLRSRLVTVFDLGGWAGLAASGEEDERSVVIVQHGTRRVGLAVDEVVRIVATGPAEDAAEAEHVRAVTFCRSLDEDQDDEPSQVFGLLNTDAVLRPVLA